MTIRAAGRRLGISERTVRRRIEAGLLGCRRDGGRVVITERHLRAYLARLEGEARQAAGASGAAPPVVDPARVRSLWPGLYGNADCGLRNVESDGG